MDLWDILFLVNNVVFLFSSFLIFINNFLKFSMFFNALLEFRYNHTTQSHEYNLKQYFNHSFPPSWLRAVREDFLRTSGVLRQLVYAVCGCSYCYDSSS